MRTWFNPVNLAVLLVMALMFMGAMTDEQDTSATAVPTPSDETPPAEPEEAAGGGGLAETAEKRTAVADDPAIIAPYANYFITQGHHGYSYDHLAIDLSAGKGADILAPISGAVTDLYLDEWGNPTLVLENERYLVTLLHGDYTVTVGDRFRQGDVIGAESNKGYTTDLNGVRCINGRECGYHTHLNIFDKQTQSNVDPFLWIAYRDWDQFQNDR